MTQKASFRAAPEPTKTITVNRRISTHKRSPWFLHKNQKAMGIETEIVK
jgi:hypothetical protein